jgi:hypothetical protein
LSLRLVVFGVAGVACVHGLACSPSQPRRATPSQRTEHEAHSHLPFVRPTLDGISATLQSMGEPTAALQLSRVTLVGALEFPGGGDRLAVEEVATWPDRYELRLRGGAGRPPVVALTGTDLRLSLPPGWRPSFQPTEGFARLRLRSLFVLRHAAQALTSAGSMVATDYPVEGAAAVQARDQYGTFRIIWGGPAGGMLAIEDDSGRVHFPAFFRSGPWFLPAMQSYESNGTISTVLYVTSIETDPER